MDINQLRTLVQVADVGSLSKAADHLCTAQPALSRQVRLLEKELRTRLFDRHGRGMILTDQGRIVLRHAVRVLAELDEIRSSVADENRTLRGRVSIGMPPTVAEILAVPLIKSIRDSHPKVVCRIVSAYSLYLLDWIHHGKIDIAILYDPKSIRSLKSEPMLEEDLFLVAPASDSLSLESAVDFRSLKDRPLILPSPDHSLRQIIERAADAAGISLDVRVEADSYTTLKQLVLSGFGCTILPLAAAQPDIASLRLCAAPLINPVPKRVLELSVPADRPISRLASMVRRRILGTSAKLAKDGIWNGQLARIR